MSIVDCGLWNGESEHGMEVMTLDQGEHHFSTTQWYVSTKHIYLELCFINVFRKLVLLNSVCVTPLAIAMH